MRTRKGVWSVALRSVCSGTYSSVSWYLLEHGPTGLLFLDVLSVPGLACNLEAALRALTLVKCASELI